MLGQSSGKAPPKKLFAALVLFVIALWLFSFRAFYPGLVTDDSTIQFHEALTGRYSNTFPPLMSATWHLLNKISSGTVVFLCLDLALYWTAFGSLAFHYLYRGRRLAIFIPVAGLFPFLLAFAGVIWKDVLLAGAWGFCCGLILLSNGIAQTRPLTAVLLRVAAGALLVFGAAMRHNAAPAGIVLALALCLVNSRASVLAKAVMSAALALLVGFAVPVSSYVLRAEDGFPLQRVFSWDLTGISYFSGEDYRVVPEQPLRTETSACYSPRFSDLCPMVSFENKTEGLSRWWKALRQHPIAYMQHRALVFSMLMRFGCSNCNPYVFVPRSQANPYGFSFTENPLHYGLGRVTYFMVKTPFSRPYLWLVASAGLALLLWVERKRPAHLILAAIAASGFIYGITYFFITITDEFRYIYWLIFSVVFVVTALVFETDILRWKRFVTFLLLPLLSIWATEHAFRAIWHTEDMAPSMATNY